MRIVIFFFVGLFFSSLFPMAMKQSGEWLFVEQVRLDHEILCSLALINKKWQQVILKTAKARKKYLELHMQELYIIPSQISWHKYGSACAYWEYETPDNDVVNFIDDKLNMHLYLIFLRGRDNNPWRQSVLRCYPACLLENPLCTESRPFFTGPEEVRFYALGWKDNPPHGDKRYLFEYALDTQGRQKKLQCFSSIFSFFAGHKHNDVIVNNFVSLDYRAKAQSLWAILQRRGVIKEDAQKKVYGIGGIAWRDQCFENISAETSI